MISLCVALLIWRQRSLVGAKALFSMVIIGSLAGVGFIFEAITDTVLQKIFWNNIQSLNQDVIAITYILFVLEYTGYIRKFDYKIFVVLLIQPMMDVFFLFTSLGNGLVKTQISLSTEPFSMLECQSGLWDWICIGYIEVLIFSSILLLIIKSSYSQGVFRRQCYTMIIGISLPFIGGLGYITNIFKGDQYYLVYVLFGMGNSIVAYGLLKERLLELFPVDVHTVLENLSDGIIILDNSNRITEINGSGEKILGVKKDKIIGMIFQNVIQEKLSYLIGPAEGSDKESTLIVDTNMQKFRMTTTILHDRKNNSLGKVVNLENITEIHNEMVRLKKEATLDKLTGALNRNSYDEILRHEIEKLANEDALISLILFDIDSFKDINDRYGHIIGDSVLRDVGAIVIDTIGAQDLFGRWGGEEFVILSKTSAAQAYNIAENLRNLFQYHSFKLVESVTASFGIAQYNGSDDIETFVTRADMAMYKAKKAGKNCIEMAYSNSGLNKN